MNNSHLGFLLSVIVLGGCGSAASATPTATKVAVVPAPSQATVPARSPEPTAAPSPPPTPTDTRTPTPSPSPARKTIKDLIAAKHPTTSFAAAVAAVKVAVNATNTVAVDFAPWPEQDFLDLMQLCKKGDPSAGGDPIRDRYSYCRDMVVENWSAYLQSGDPRFYDAALTVCNYARTRLGDKWKYYKSDIDGYLTEVFP